MSTMFNRRKQLSLLKLRQWNSKLNLRVPTPPAIRLPTANLIGFLLCYFIGAYGFNVLLLFPIILVLYMYWAEKHELLMKTVELSVERKMLRRRAISGAEGLEWVNFAFDRWWGCCMPSVTNFTKDWIEPIIDSFKLPVGVECIEIVAFDTGTYRPILSNVRLLEQTMEGSDSFQPVSMTTMTTPPGASQKKSSLVFEFDVDFDVPEAYFIMRTRLGSRRFGQNFLMNVKSFHLKGCIRSILNASASVPFPHLTTGKVSFVREPLVEASARIFKQYVQVFNVPVLKDAVTEYVIYGLNKMLVYPGGVDIDFSPPKEPRTEWEGLQQSGLAHGVLTVTVNVTTPCGKEEWKGESMQYCSLRLGNQKCVGSLGSNSDPWCFSFLIHNTAEDTLVVKVKRKKALRKHVVIDRRVELQSLDLQNDSLPSRNITMSAKDVQLMLALTYTPLPKFSLIKPGHISTDTHREHHSAAGVLYIHIHGAKDLPIYNYSSIPQCTVHIGDNRTILATRCVPNTRSPIWEEGVELLVPNYQTIKLSFEVSILNGKTRSSDEPLGSTHLDLSTVRSCNIQQKLPLTIEKKTGSSISLYISTVFRPVESVSQTDFVPWTYRHRNSLEPLTYRPRNSLEPLTNRRRNSLEPLTNRHRNSLEPRAFLHSYSLEPRTCYRRRNSLESRTTVYYHRHRASIAEEDMNYM